MSKKTLRMIALGAITTLGIPAASIAVAAPAGAAPNDLTACSFSPSSLTWNSSDITTTVGTGTPSAGNTVYLAETKAPGGSWTEAGHADTTFSAGPLPQAGAEQQTYQNFLALLGGTDGSIRISYWPVGTTDFSGTPLCSLTISASTGPAPTTTTTTTTTTAPATTTTTAPKTVLAATGSDSEGMILLGSMTVLLGAGAVVVSRRRRSHASS